jgi:hypothetical protein
MGEWSGEHGYRPRERFKGPLFRVALDHLAEFEVQLAWPSDSWPRPQQRYRQWVLVVPKRLRRLMDIHPTLIGEAASILAREVELFFGRRCGAGSPANISFVQRFGSRLNLHQHISYNSTRQQIRRLFGAMGGWTAQVGDAGSMSISIYQYLYRYFDIMGYRAENIITNLRIMCVVRH